MPKRNVQQNKDAQQEESPIFVWLKRFWRLVLALAAIIATKFYMQPDVSIDSTPEATSSKAEIVFWPHADPNKLDPTADKGGVVRYRASLKLSNANKLAVYFPGASAKATLLAGKDFQPITASLMRDEAAEENLEDQQLAVATSKEIVFRVRFPIAASQVHALHIGACQNPGLPKIRLAVEVRTEWLEKAGCLPFLCRNREFTVEDIPFQVKLPATALSPESKSFCDHLRGHIERYPEVVKSSK